MIRFIALLFLILPVLTQAQTAAANDTTIYKIVQEMPLFPGCGQLDTTQQVKQECSQTLLLDYVYRRVLYPEEARQQGIQGTVVLTFVVEKDGTISNPSILRDLGGNTGVAALRVLLGMQEDGMKWTPGRQNGQPVRVQYTLPVKFKIEEPKPYVMAGLDSIYVEFDEPLQFAGGDTALTTYLNEQLTYPASGNDSCRIGQMDLKLRIDEQGRARILDITDYNDLGFDFWYEAIHTTISTSGKWKPAVYQGRKVPSSMDISLSFLPTTAGCKTRADAYGQALDAAQAGADLVEEGKLDEGLGRMTQALEQFPNDGRLLLLRGQVYLNNNRFPEACADLSKARRIALIDWHDNILPLICREPEK